MTSLPTWPTTSDRSGPSSVDGARPLPRSSSRAYGPDVRRPTRARVLDRRVRLVRGLRRGRAPGRPERLGLAVSVQTLFLQTARSDRPDASDDVLNAIGSGPSPSRARRGMQVVGWYLPTHLDPVLDPAVASPSWRTSFDGFALDIESRVEPDVALRNRRLAVLCAACGVQQARPLLGAIVVPPTTTEDVNPQYWPGFDWAMLTSTFDVFLPMNYWTDRLSGSPWRDAAASTAENIRRLRAHAGRADCPVHVVGGIADPSPRPRWRPWCGRRGRRAPGVSLYDLATTGADLWPALR